MKLKEIARTYGIDEIRLDMFLDREGDRLGISKHGLFESSIDDSDVERAVNAFKTYEEINSPEGKKRLAEEKKRQQLLQQERDQQSVQEAGGHWEYKVVTLVDEATGILDPAQLESTLNDLGNRGWHLKCAYANEIGRTMQSSGVAGTTTGTNATLDQNILIFERFVKL